MDTETGFPKTLQEAIKYFADDGRAFDYMKKIRWPDGVVRCPRCDCDQVSFISTRKLWTCKTCKEKKQFTLKVGTIFEDSPIKFDKWICAIWLIANAKNGISSYELGRSLGVCQKTGWFMLQRIRLAMQQGSVMKMKGLVEADESFIGGLARNMHKVKREKMKNLSSGGKRRARGTVGKTAVMGLLERNSPEKHSRVRVKVVETVRRHDLENQVRDHVEKGSEVITDQLRSYNKLHDEYVHNVINHAECYAKGHVHVNGLENFWALLKRGIKGTYVSVEPFHLFRYLDEQAFRFNERKDNDQGRFEKAISGIIGRKVTWASLTGKDAQAQALPA